MRIESIMALYMTLWDADAFIMKLGPVWHVGFRIVKTRMMYVVLPLLRSAL